MSVHDGPEYAGRGVMRRITVRIALFEIGQTIIVIVVVADITFGIAIVILLQGVCWIRAVVCVIRHPVTVGIGSTGIAAGPAVRLCFNRSGPVRY